MTARNMIQTTTTRTIGRNNFARLAVSTFHLARQSITPNAQIAFALAVDQVFAVTLSMVSKSLKPNTEHKRPRGESVGDRTMPATNHSQEAHNHFQDRTAYWEHRQSVCKEGIAKDAAKTSPINRRTILCVVVATAPAGIVLGASRGRPRGAVAEGGAKDAAKTSPINRRTILCVLVATAPAAIVLGAQSRGLAEGGAKDAAMTYQLDLPVIHSVTLAI